MREHQRQVGNLKFLRLQIITDYYYRLLQIIIIIIIINVPDHMMTSFTAGSSRDGDANLPDAFLDNKHEIVDDWRHVDTVSSRPQKVESAENIQGS